MGCPFALAYVLVMGSESWMDKEKDKRKMGVEGDWNRKFDEISGAKNLFSAQSCNVSGLYHLYGYSRYLRPSTCFLCLYST